MQSSMFSKTIFDLSPEIQQLAEKEELGVLRQIYPVSKRFTRIWVIGQVCIAWGIIGTPIIVAARLFSTNPPPLLLTQVMVVAGLLLLIMGYYMSFARRIYAHWQVSLWQHGFIYEKGQTQQAFQWQQIESIQANATRVRNGPAPILYTYKVQRQDGYEVILGSVFSNGPELIDHVLEEFARQLAPQGVNIISPHNTRTFTVFTVGRQGVSNKQETLSWQEIQDFITKNGTVTLRKQEE